ncbi:hypothetical protein F4556_000328 [Kitasatospora gansuensis]|uniref:Ricin B lectin domain-containing protein n=1 Tax=Kitasatospora gansuensis TaxID=258050 RepID=A0A7W7S6G6_9ACTN|nr:ricin-type beta-trefoil lectin domain protein [Kitasatospora gansuensis]MBB4944793.1 hypothetical protein [Kitasatospora gansuensis]
MSPPALAAGTTVPPLGQRPALSAEAQAIQDAQAKAKSTGAAVTVDALTTQTSLTTANPNGTLSTTQHVQPVRTKKAERWVDLDPTLRQNPDGTLSPSVSTSPLSFSGGGSGPLATIATEDGKKLAIGSPFKLPKPTLDGATATYTSVLPDVDLQVSALPSGGWRDVVIVHTAAAAADPALRTLHFPVSGTDLTPSSDSAGNVQLTDASGAVRLHAPTPLQWDSTQPAPSAPDAPLSRSLSAAPAAVAPGNAEAAKDPEASTTAAPGIAAAIAPMSVSASRNAIDLTPDQKTFGKGTGPWYLDPTVSADNPSQLSVQVQEYHPDTKYANTISNLGTGYCGYSDCTGYGRERAYYQLGINSVLTTIPSGAHSGAVVHDAALYLQSTGSASPSTSTPMGLYWAGPISTDTTWRNQPCNGPGTMGGCTKVGSTWMMGTGQVGFDVTSQMQKAVAEKWTNWTVAVGPDDENNKYYRQHFANNPHIVVNYDIAPTLWYPRTSPSPGIASKNTSYDCTSGGASPWDNAAWIASNQNIRLAVNNWSPTGLPLHTAFRMWDDNDGNGGWTGDSGWAGSYNDGSGVGVDVGPLKDGHQYGWTATATDDNLSSPESPWCYFRVDRTQPTVSVSSTDFPPSGTPNPSPTKFNTSTDATFTITGTDPAPGAGLNASGLACFRVSANPTPVIGWHCGDADTYGADGNGQATYPRPATPWGTNFVYAQAQDNAGNYSQPAVYSYYAPWDASKSAQPRFGDTTGDGKPDLVLPDTAGNLRLIGGINDPLNAVSAPAALAPAISPAVGDWNTVQVTHRGSLRGQVPVDDLIAHPANSANLYLYLNDGRGVYTSGSTIVAKPSTCQDAKGVATTCPANWGPNFSNVTQILALGTPEGEALSTDGTTTLTKTSLLAVVNKQLWLFHSGSSNVKLLDGTARLLSSQVDWDSYDLIGPGLAGGTAQPTVWARNRTDGTVHAYQVKGGVTPDYSAFATAGDTIKTGISTAAYPTVGSSGDLNGDGSADLWTLGSDGKLLVWPGNAAAVSTLGTQVALGDLRSPVGRWTLNSTSGGTTPDTLGKHPATVQGAVTFPTDTVAGKSTAVAAFDSKGSGALTAANSTLDSSKSFSVSLWAKPSALGGVAVSQDGANASGFLVWPDGDGTWHFGLGTVDDGWSYDQTTAATSNANRVQLNTWTQLTASYNATTRQMSLYVNGVLAGSGYHTQNSGITGQLVIGRYKYLGQPISYFDGRVSDVAVYDFPSTIATGSSRLVSAAGVNKCLDDANAGTTNGSPIEIYDCNGTPAQQFSVNANGTLGILNGCVDAIDAGTSNGTLLQYLNCNGSPAQQWLPRADGSVINPQSGKCLDAPGGNTANGTRPQLYDCNGTYAQRWIVTPAN